MMLALLFSRSACALVWNELGATVAKSVLACASMALAVTAMLRFLAPPEETTRFEQAWSLASAIGGGVGIYFAVAWALGMSELRLLFVRPRVARDGDEH